MGAVTIMHHSYWTLSAVWESPHLGLVTRLGSQQHGFHFTGEEVEACEG